ncbi:hypothetical protein SAMN04488563_6060 [Jiangella alkaliphila]|uniref:TspO and MBR related proteins n=2 Tax=Jiangella alkaliphila TaxID=419479 RepID=A0A1H2LGK8_9ACTN|nr:hypothetical protein SAMN04488563_6060 [Jiangella alkaliphila]
MVLVPTLGPLVADTEEGADQHDTEITPPDYAFAIWAPIFVSTAANALQRALNPTAPVNRRTGWWLTGAYGANAAWSIAAQSDRFRYTPFVLPVAAGFAAVAHRRAQNDRPSGIEHVAAESSASFRMDQRGHSRQRLRDQPARQTRDPDTNRANRSSPHVAEAAVALTASIGTSRHGYTSTGLACTWAFAANAANPERTAPWTRALAP